jgi:hypothetical protein
MMFSFVTGLPPPTPPPVFPAVVRRLRRYYTPVSTPRWHACPGSRFWLSGPDAGEVSRFSRVRFLDVRMALGLCGASRQLSLRSRQCGLPVACTRPTPGIRFSKLDSSPVDASVYTSPGASRRPAQDSLLPLGGLFHPLLLWGSFIPVCTPVYPDAGACLRMRL